MDIDYLQRELNADRRLTGSSAIDERLHEVYIYIWFNSGGTG